MYGGSTSTLRNQVHLKHLEITDSDIFLAYFAIRVDKVIISNFQEYRAMNAFTGDIVDIKITNIGEMTTPFTFSGTGMSITNLNVDQAVINNSDYGLFRGTELIENVTLKNVICNSPKCFEANFKNLVLKNFKTTLNGALNNLFYARTSSETHVSITLDDLSITATGGAVFLLSEKNTTSNNKITNCSVKGTNLGLSSEKFSNNSNTSFKRSQNVTIASIAAGGTATYNINLQGVLQSEHSLTTFEAIGNIPETVIITKTLIDNAVSVSLKNNSTETVSLGTVKFRVSAEHF